MREELKQDREMRIWRNLTPAQRDYDRFVGRIPYRASRWCETRDGQSAIDQRDRERDRERDEARDRECTCHIMPPCSFCTDSDEPAPTGTGG